MSVMESSESFSVPVTCNRDCGGDCPLIAHVEDRRVVKITDNPLGGPYLSGCVKGLQAAKVLYSPYRLRRPLLRTGPRGSGEFKEINWDQALDIVAEHLKEIKERHGSEAIIYLGGSGSGCGALHSSWRTTLRFLSLFGGFTATTSSYSSAAGRFVNPYLLGKLDGGMDPGNLEHSELIILWGANVVDTRLEAGLEPRIREAKARGVEVIVIDPRRTTTAKTLGTKWISIYPGTDTALMMAVLHVLINEDLVDSTFVERYSHGFQQLQEYVIGASDGVAKSPEWAEEICGVSAERIVELARLYGRKRPTALIPGLSIQRTIGGEEAIRTATALQVATGNLGVPGGSTGTLTWGRLPSPRVGGLGIPPNPSGAAVPVYRWPDAILEGKKGGYPSDIKAIYNVGCNYLIQGSDIHKNIRAFEAVEFSVCHDVFLTPTAIYCDVVLPVTIFLERNDIINPDGGNYLLFSNRAVPPLPEAKNDYDIFCALSKRLGFLEEYSEDRDEEAWLRSFVDDSDIPDYDEFRRNGIFWGEDQARTALSDFVADPKMNPLNTPSGLVEISSELYAETGFPAFPTWRGLEPEKAYPLKLVSPKSRYWVHSQNYNIPWFREREQHGLWINHRDAAERGVGDGDTVIVSSPQGRTRVTSIVTEDIMPGVVCLVEGVWANLDSEGMETAGSVNVLTSTVPTMPSHGSRTHSVNVQVEKA